MFNAIRSIFRFDEMARLLIFCITIAGVNRSIDSYLLWNYSMEYVDSTGSNSIYGDVSIQAQRCLLSRPTFNLVSPVPSRGQIYVEATRDPNHEKLKTFLT